MTDYNLHEMAKTDISNIGQVIEWSIKGHIAEHEDCDSSCRALRGLKYQLFLVKSIMEDKRS